MDIIIYVSAIVVGMICLLGGHCIAKGAEADIALSAKESTYDGCSPRMAYVFYFAFPLFMGSCFIAYGLHCALVPAL